MIKKLNKIIYRRKLINEIIALTESGCLKWQYFPLTEGISRYRVPVDWFQAKFGGTKIKIADFGGGIALKEIWIDSSYGCVEYNALNAWYKKRKIWKMLKNKPWKVKDECEESDLTEEQEKHLKHLIEMATFGKTIKSMLGK